MVFSGLLITSAWAGVSVVRSPKSPYQAQRIYNGPNSADAIYFRNPGNPQWQRGFALVLKKVTCRPALDGFYATGLWQGHLNPNGSCEDPSEPSQWATGNRLNYDGVTADSGK